MSLVDPAKVLSTKCMASSHTRSRKAKMVAINKATATVANPAAAFKTGE